MPPDNSGVGEALRVKDEIVAVASDQDPTLARGEGQLLFVGSSDVTCFKSGEDVDVAMPESRGGVGEDVFIEVVPNQHGVLI